MKAYVMDAFSSKVFGGNQAGVVLPEGDLREETMRQIACELKHSETAFVRLFTNGVVQLRYFTPAGEVELCGHATIGSFALLRKLHWIENGMHTAMTNAGELSVEVCEDTVWMDMAAPKLLKTLAGAEIEELYAAYGLKAEDCPEGFAPKIVSTGLADIMMPVRDHDLLMKAVQNEDVVSAISRKYECTGVHMFCMGDGNRKAYCSNYAPLVAIPEECATGTSNGALTYYLYLQGLIRENEENLFVQGEHMNRPSEIYSRLKMINGLPTVQIGGQAVMSLSGELNI